MKLTDFGMASLADDEAGAEVRGTSGYLAPELVRGEPPTEVSDLFSLGVTFYEALAGRAAFTGADTGALLDAVLHDDPLPRLERFTDLPPALHPICARLLAKNPDERYPDTATLIVDLEAFRAACGVETGAAALTPTSTIRRPTEERRVFFSPPSQSQHRRAKIDTPPLARRRVGGGPGGPCWWCSS